MILSRSLTSVLALTASLLASLPATAEMTLDPGTSVTFHHHDLLGSPVMVSDHKGRVLWYENTRPYGESLGKKSSSGLGHLDNTVNEATSNLGYTGHTVDSSTGLVYMKARHYDPVIGRFYSNDPVGFRASNPMLFNRYAYANNNPYVFVDLDGRAPNQAGATDYLNISSAISASGGLSGIAVNVSNTDRYFHTDTYGWVDVRHFGTAAGFTNGWMPGSLVKVLGFGVEIVQSLKELAGNGDDSGFSEEDLPSNSAGVAFSQYADEYMKYNPNATLAEAFEAWAVSEGAVDSTSTTYQNSVQNLPATDPPAGAGDSNSTSATGSGSSEKENSSTSSSTSSVTSP